MDSAIKQKPGLHRALLLFVYQFSSGVVCFSEYFIEVFEKMFEGKDKVRGIKIVEEPEFLRHFTAKFERL